MNLHIRVLHNGLTTKMFSAECGSPLNSSRVATANLVLYPTIIPGYLSIPVTPPCCHQPAPAHTAIRCRGGPCHAMLCQLAATLIR